jgi:hypothetical protein
MANENFNEHFKAIFEVHGQVPTRGLINTHRFAVGAVLVYQLALLYRHERNLDIDRGLKAFLSDDVSSSRPGNSDSASPLWMPRRETRRTSISPPAADLPD